jgi:hypothetical protein
LTRRRERKVDADGKPIGTKCSICMKFKHTARNCPLKIRGVDVTAHLAIEDDPIPTTMTNKAVAVLCHIIDEEGHVTSDEEEEVAIIQEVAQKLSRKKWTENKSRLTGAHNHVAVSEVSGGHDARRICMYCKLSRNSVKCFQCNVFLHIGYGYPNCFSKWHSEDHLCAPMKK